MTRDMSLKFADSRFNFEDHWDDAAARNTYRIRDVLISMHHCRKYTIINQEIWERFGYYTGLGYRKPLYGIETVDNEDFVDWLDWSSENTDSRTGSVILWFWCRRMELNYDIDATVQLSKIDDKNLTTSLTTTWNLTSRFFVWYKASYLNWDLLSKANDYCSISSQVLRTETPSRRIEARLICSNLSWRIIWTRRV